jgi:hypothetical protein
MQPLTLQIGQGAGLTPLALMPNNPFGVMGPINDQLSGGVRYGAIRLGAASSTSTGSTTTATWHARVHMRAPLR